MLGPGRRAFIERNLPGFSKRAGRLRPRAARRRSAPFCVSGRKPVLNGRSFLSVGFRGRGLAPIPGDTGRAVGADSVPAADSASDPGQGLILEEDSASVRSSDTSRCGGDHGASKKSTGGRSMPLPRWQSLEAAESPTIAARAMDHATFMWESGYFAGHCVPSSLRSRLTARCGL